jgi:hypothetical protein
LVDYKDNELTRRLRAELEAINQFLASIDIGVRGVDVRNDGHRWVFAHTHYFPSRPHLHRVFSRGSFDKGGRAYGWWQSLPSRQRAMMTLDGDPVLEPDFVCLHAQILYAERSIELVGDAYETGDFPRDQGKQAFNIALNASSRPSALAAIAHDLQIGPKAAAKLLAAMITKHKAVADAFCSDAGVRLMRVDSDIALRAVKTCEAKGIPTLPVHDSLIVPARHAGQTAEIMEAAFADHFPLSSNCRVKIKSPSVQSVMTDSFRETHNPPVVHKE